MKVKSVPPEEVVAALKKWKEKLSREHPEVKRVGYFGSYATGSYTPSSDLDVILVLRDCPRPFPARLADYSAEGIPVACEVFPYTEKEIEQLGKEDSPWIKQILKETVWLE
ncbi:MAG TPA: nucleotidyltransferase domain-containing protein [bacterium]|nr:nucleotidyltransferase domain-containing protein [bacterium]HOL68051.1 nucleotidyltransferase domain-containing protein [bacterium]